jgi:hypothetical protein
MKQSRKDFIIEAHDNACNDWRNRIEKEFPKLFKKDSLEVGKWYKSEIAIFKVTALKPLKSYGVFSGKWGVEACTSITTKNRPATDKEVEQALIKEAKKRGFKEGVKFEDVMGNLSVFKRFADFYLSNSHFNCFTKDSDVVSFFLKGKWAKIIKETITKEQAEKELGKTILN